MIKRINIIDNKVYSISTIAPKAPEMWNKWLFESERGPYWLSSSQCFMCACVWEKHREREGQMEGWEAYSDTVFLVMAN